MRVILRLFSDDLYDVCITKDGREWTAVYSDKSFNKASFILGAFRKVGHEDMTDYEDLFYDEEHSPNLKSKNNIQQQPQECGNTSNSCVEEKNSQLGACSSVSDDSGEIQSGSVEDYPPSSSPVVDTNNLNKESKE